MSVKRLQTLVFLRVLLPIQGFAAPQQSDISAMALTVTRSKPMNSEGLAELLSRVTTLTPDTDNSWNVLNALLAWLKSLNPESYEAHYQWLKRVWQALMPSAATFELLANSLMVLIAIALAVVIGWIGRKEGWWQKRLMIKPSLFPLPSAYATELKMPDINTLTPKQHIYALLMQYRRALIQHYHLPNNNALTHREFLALLTQPTLSRHFQGLLEVSEPILYGKQLVSMAELNAFKQYYSHLTRARDHER